jgi:hypothetical protein
VYTFFTNLGRVDTESAFETCDGSNITILGGGFDSPVELLLDSPGVYYFVSDVIYPNGNACKAGAKIKVTVAGGNEEGQTDFEGDEEDVKSPPTSDGKRSSRCVTFWCHVAACLLAFLL